MKKLLLILCLSVFLLLSSCAKKSNEPVQEEKKEEASIQLGAIVNFYEDQNTYTEFENWIYTFTDKADQSCVLSKDKTYIFDTGYISTGENHSYGKQIFVYDKNILEIRSIYDIVKEEHGPVYCSGYKIRNISGSSEATLGVYLEPYLVKIKIKFE